MNLRQKVKQAKKELAELDELYSSYSIWDIFHKVTRQLELQEIIDYKRKPSKMYGWNEEYDIDWDKLTYISFQIDYKEILRLMYPNGKVLSKREIEEFVRECVSKIPSESEKIAQIDINDDSRDDYWKGRRRRIDYTILVSNDRTKSKKFHKEDKFFQFEGDNRIYQFEKNDKENESK